MKTYVHLWQYLTEFLEVFQTKVVEKIKTQFMFNNFFCENYVLCEII